LEIPVTDLRDLPPFLDRLADAAANAIMPHFRAAAPVEDKGKGRFDPVTIADRAAEEAMRELIGTEYPAHGIIGEEFGSEHPDAEFVWVLDPIDGTRAFISGLPVWGTLIGLLQNGKPVLGMMAQPFTGERYGGDGARAWYVGPDGSKPLRTRPCARLRDASLFTTTPMLFKGADRAAYDRVEGAARMPRYGTDCYAYCMVAAGHADIVVENDLQIYDIAALIPIIQGAGGQVTNWQGGSAADGGSVVATGDRRVHEEALAKLAG
jgi:myo-inositol-1(or 4)-monophosphatase